MYTDIYNRGCNNTCVWLTIMLNLLMLLGRTMSFCYNDANYFTSRLYCCRRTPKWPKPRVQFSKKNKVKNNIIYSTRNAC